MAANWKQARLVAPVEHYDESRWREHWQEHPDSFLQVLGDIYRIYKSEEAKKNGTANPQGGRRKTTIDGNITELWALVTPTFSMETFPAAFVAAQGDRSLQKVAVDSGMNRGTLHRYLGRGPRRDTPGRYEIERIARALDIHPAYFREWRELILCEYLVGALASKPNLSISLLKAIS